MTRRIALLPVLSLLLALLPGCGASRTMPDVAKAYRDRGEARLVAAGAHDDAIADFTRAISYDPDDANLYADRGLAYLKKGDSAKARLDFEKAASLDATLGKALLPLLTESAWIRVGEWGGRSYSVDRGTLSVSKEEGIVTAYLHDGLDVVYVEIDCVGRKSRRTDVGRDALRDWIEMRTDSPVGMVAGKFCR